MAELKSGLKNIAGMTPEMVKKNIEDVYKVANPDLSDREVKETMEEASIIDIIKASQAGEELTNSEIKKLDEYDIKNPEESARIKMKFSNPEMTNIEIYKKVKEQMAVEKAAAKTTKEKSGTSGSKGTSTVTAVVQPSIKLDMMNDLYGELSAENIELNKNSADQYLREMYPKSTVAQRADIASQLMTYDPSSKGYSLISEDEMNVKAARRVMFSSYIYLPIVLLSLLADKLH
jgi:hypothetical protein